MYSQSSFEKYLCRRSNELTSIISKFTKNHDCHNNSETIKTKRKYAKYFSLSIKSILFAILGLLNLVNATYDTVNITSHRSNVNYNYRLNKNNAPIYQNEFAVYIPKGQNAADAIASKYGFENAGQVNIFFHKVLSNHLILCNLIDWEPE